MLPEGFTTFCITVLQGLMDLHRRVCALERGDLSCRYKQMMRHRDKTEPLPMEKVHAMLVTLTEEPEESSDAK